MLLNWFSIIFFNNRQIWTFYRIAIVKGDQKTTGVNISGTVCLIYLKLLQIWTEVKKFSINAVQRHLEYNNIEVWKLILLCSWRCTAKSRNTALHCRISFQYRSDNKLFETLSTGPAINNEHKYAHKWTRLYCFPLAKKSVFMTYFPSIRDGFLPCQS